MTARSQENQSTKEGPWRYTIGCTYGALTRLASRGSPTAPLPARSMLTARGTTWMHHSGGRRQSGNGRERGVLGLEKLLEVKAIQL